VAAVFTGFYMTRLVFLTFFGNERWHPDQDEADAPVRAPAIDIEDSDPSPTVSYGDPVHVPHEDRPPHESPWIMTLPILVLAALAAVAGFVNMPLRGVEYFDDWLAPSFRGIAHAEPSSFLQGLALEIVSVLLALVGIGLAFALYRHGLRRASEEPLDVRLGAGARVFGHAYYYDATISKFVDGPGRGFAGWLDRVVDRRIIDGAVDGVGGLVKRGARALRHLQDGLVRRYALGIAFGVAALLLYVVMRVGS
jgi:NADH-quinone oxidoreductase subunit L